MKDKHIIEMGPAKDIQKKLNQWEGNYQLLNISIIPVPGSGGEVLLYCVRREFNTTDHEES